MMRVQLRDSAAERETLQIQLVAAENRASRLQSKTVLAMHTRAVVKEEPKPEEIEELQRKTPSSPAVSGPVNWWESSLLIP
jgi:hypothetical protein